MCVEEVPSLARILHYVSSSFIPLVRATPFDPSSIPLVAILICVVPRDTRYAASRANGTRERYAYRGLYPAYAANHYFRVLKK